MNDKLIRSGARHTVVFDERTRNAVSPHNESDGVDLPPEAIHDHLEIVSQAADDKSAPSPLDNQAAPEQGATVAIPTEVISVQSTPTVPKKHLKSNLQKITVDQPTDSNKFHESVLHLKDQLLHFKTSTEAFTDRMVYLEKKNIKDHRIKFDDSAHQATNPASVPSQKIDPHGAHQEQETPSLFIAKNTHDPVMSKTASDHHHSNLLQERIDKLKKDVSHVNESLKDIKDPGPDTST